MYRVRASRRMNTCLPCGAYQYSREDVIVTWHAQSLISFTLYTLHGYNTKLATGTVVSCEPRHGQANQIRSCRGTDRVPIRPSLPQRLQDKDVHGDAMFLLDFLM